MKERGIIIKIKNLTSCALLAALICISSVIKISLIYTPIPITLQLAVVLLAGSLLGASYGSLSVIIYILLGTVGLPVFAGMNAGIGYLFGPTGGFFIGFIPCAIICGKLTNCFFIARGSAFMQIASIFVAMALGTLALYVCGGLYFSIIMECGLRKAIALSVLPFIWIDLLKIIVTSIVARQLLLNIEF